MDNMIYSVSFHTKSPKGPHTFWFTDFDMATQFGYSLQMNPKVTDCSIYELEANVAAEYDRKVKDTQIRVVETWERGKQPPRMLANLESDTAAQTAERTEPKHEE